jgi:hypothetical protein
LDLFFFKNILLALICYDEIETEIATYTKTTSEEWNQVSCEDDDGNGRTIDPIRCTVDEDFSVLNITDE